MKIVFNIHEACPNIFNRRIMALYLAKAIFINRAPFNHLELDFKEKGINVLSAINGKGKTTILSHIVDSFYELAKRYYKNEFEGKEDKYYRISTSLFNTEITNSSFVYLRFLMNGENLDYIDIRNKCSKTDYDKAITIVDKIPFEKFSSSFTRINGVKYWHIDQRNDDELRSSTFDNNILTYFPSYRYEIPSYLNDSYKFKINYKLEAGFNGYLPNPIEVITGLHQLANWIMDVVMDWEVYKQDQSQRIKLPDGTTRMVDFSPELNIWNNLNEVLRKTLSSKKIVGNCRMGIGKRNDAGTRISIIAENDGEKTTVSPNLFCLSSGESALLCCFGELLRQADVIHPNTGLKDIKGIVLIDEVDKHLHIKLQNEVLPKLFNLFPNVQFIVSSHSPFFNMGLADNAKERTQIIDIDNNGLISEPTNNNLYKEVYEMMINENQRFAVRYRELEEKMNTMNKPVIITEGKTDWKHLKTALEHFKEVGEFTDLDIEILEYDFNFGDSKLHNLLNQYKTFPHRYKVIGVFDCDEDNGRSIHDEGGIREYGDKIWGISIPIPEFRSYNSGISIEFLYHDEDLKREDENGRRLYVTSEFNECGRLKSDIQKGVKNYDKIKKYLVPDKEKIKAEDVVDIEGNSLALSKDQFAQYISEKEGVFASVNFDAFKAVFERLRLIIQK